MPESALQNPQTPACSPITLHGLDDDGPGVIALARQLQRESAHDAAYVVLAELEADLWTIDGPPRSQCSE